MWTKREIIQEAFGELALQGFVFNVEPEDLASALRKLDVFMAMMKPKKLFLTYNTPLSPSTGDELDDDSGLTDAEIEAAILNVAIRIASSFGKQVPQSTLGPAKMALDTVMIAAAQPYRQQLPETLPRGAGNKTWRWGTYVTFFNPCCKSIPTTCDETTTP